MSNVSLKEEAREGVVYLEAMCGERLDEVPVHERDQRAAHIRDMFKDCDVDLNDPVFANAAFIGARLGVATLMSNSPNSGKATAHLLRYLMDKSDGYEDTGKRRRFRLWLAERILPK